MGGEVPPAAKGGPTSEAGQPGLALTPPLGHAGTQGGPKGGLRPLISRDGVWRGPYLTWGVFGGLYTTWGQFPSAAAREDDPVPASAYETGRGQADLPAGGCPPQGGLRLRQEGSRGLFSLTSLLGIVPSHLQGREDLPRGHRRPGRGHLS